MMKVVSLILLFFSFIVNAEELTKEQKEKIIIDNLAKDCAKYGVNCRLNPVYNNNNNINNPCRNDQKTCMDTSEKDKIAVYCKKIDENC
ncbi:MAG: hypothetical protein OEY79_04965, partial [Anaplasmataceae bacterium]|nr:hypothetical protein [Anaplasmataceae bacterium]